VAITSSLRIIAKRIAQAVRLATLNLGITSDHYLLIGSYDEESGRISLTAGVDCPVDKSLLFAAIIRELRQEFSDSPGFVMQIGLVIRKVSKLDDVYYQDSLGSLNGDEELDLTDMLQLA
jgi:hypothetical protein